MNHSALREQLCHRPAAIIPLQQEFSHPRMGGVYWEAVAKRQPRRALPQSRT